jgi:hypothetical protein
MARNSIAEKPWERQKGESSQAFEAFSLYLKMGEKRSLRSLAQRLGKSSALMNRWSSRWNWQERLRAYENDLRRQEIEADRKDRKAMRERQIKTAMLMQKKAVEALDKIKPEELTPRAILEYIKAGAELERLNRVIEDDTDSDSSDIVYQMEIEDLDQIESDIYGNKD